MINKTFKIFYRHPDGGFRYITNVSVEANDNFGFMNCLEEVYWQMQGEQWSPKGEKRELIMSLGLKHTSMSIGDIAMDADTNEFWRVEDVGWKKVTTPCEP